MHARPKVLKFSPIRYAEAEWLKLSEVAEVIPVTVASRSEFIDKLHGEFSDIVGIGRGYLTVKQVGLFDKELISHFPSTLKYIAHQGAGYDQIDAKALAERGIQLANAPGIVDAATADTALFLILGAMRNFDYGRKNLKEGKWPAGGFAAGAPLGITPRNKILGIIGMGGIGRAVCERVRPLGFEKFVYYNRSRLNEELEQGAIYVSLERLLEVADVISLHCPLNETTWHLLNDERIQHMKYGAIIVNTARGAVIDEHALVKHLKSGRIAGAGLDVFEYEPSVSRELLDLPNVLALPHMGTQAVQTVKEMEECVVKNIYSGITKGRVETLVPEQKSFFTEAYEI
ncbi:BDM_1a_G0031710.mRNA.1.CDS.1 [Saccharomyces cerevisiae]|uniref:Glyoxylate reductase n=1 Tax=Saccharomyces cerevisiae (strain AWRI1631) TaxID=545124 RepID=B5VTZ0_YEAS6|nr:hypothetical protein AWRI1631_10980040 [Saccharomyces cerevisiae AWRI1631]CAI4527051.1 AHG_G0025630.mRNA.1.CDS.1 [Saccharomyces cerevisiae]CAI4577582.1 BDM_1a_G0031710.mRNA.1.CDS.1 [Saccharomyces cerevisiae]CAI6719994.1 AHG_G0025630.mRNA.1.CDS.1 [Saccharomyces cerevisiae]CAI7196132.1 BDM_1a_G0031710.mRNA.1.CDS.1 [Saccharomyces cerevisiae]